MGTILNYINKIAEKLEGEFPDVLVQTLCYEWSCELPKGGVVPRDNVIVELCLNMCKDHMCDDTDCEIVEETMGLLKGWSELTDQLYIWSYPGSWTNSFRVRGGFKSYWSQANAFAENNVVAHYAEITGVECPEFSEWRAYLWAKLNKNPSMSYAEYRYHMEDFAYGYYGDSAEGRKHNIALAARAIDGAVLLPEGESSGEKLHALAAELLDSPERRREMSRALGALSIPDAAEQIYQTLTALLRR